MESKQELNAKNNDEWRNVVETEKQQVHHVGLLLLMRILQSVLILLLFWK
jgi:hypothetical protein